MKYPFINIYPSPKPTEFGPSFGTVRYETRAIADENAMPDRIGVVELAAIDEAVLLAFDGAGLVSGGMRVLT